MKFKVEVIQTRVFETTMDDYPDCISEDQALEYEQMSAADDPSVVLDHPDTETKVSVTRVD